MNITKIIKEIRNIIGLNWSSQIHIHIYNDEIYFGIYETEVPIIIDLKNKDVYVDCEASGHHLCSDMLDELSKICKLLEENLEVIEDLLRMD